MKLRDLHNGIIIWGVPGEELFLFLETCSGLCILPEMRPSGIGLRINREICNIRNIPFCVCTDNMLGNLFFQKKIKQVVVFSMKEEKENIVCFPGTFTLLMLARLHSVPVKLLPAGLFQKDVLIDKDAQTISGKPLVEQLKQEFLFSQESEIISRKEFA